MNSKITLCISLASVLFGLSVSAKAGAVVDGASWDGGAGAGIGESSNNAFIDQFSPLPQSANAVWNNEGGSGVTASAGVTITGLSIPAILVTAAVSTSNPPVGDAGANGHLIYFFELTAIPGFGGTVIGVPVLMNGTSGLSMNGSTGTTTNSSVSMQVTTADQTSSLYNLNTGNNGVFGATLSIIPNVEYEVSMSATVGVGNGSGSAAASIDPMFTIDPTFQFANDFQFTFSPGIGNSTGAVTGAVPEPSTWAMLLIGFAGIGFMICKRDAATCNWT